MGSELDGFVTRKFQSLLEDGVLEIGDGYRAKNSELTGGGEIFLRAGHVTDSHIDFDGVERFSPELAEKLAPKMSRVGDTIVTTKGNSTGRTSFVTDRMPRFVYSPHLCYWRSADSSVLDNGFLRYWAQSCEFRTQLAGLKGSTDMAPYLSLTDQRRLLITIPTIDKQRAIASILGSLDDKIDLNRRMNGTLESIARAIFKSWFVDFDPVRWNSEGKPLTHPTNPDHHLPESTAALFPSTFQDSEMGKIPTGWSAQSLSEMCDVQSGGTPKKSVEAYWDGVLPWISPKAMMTLHAFDSDEHVTEGAVGNGTRLVSKGTVLVMVRGMGLHRGVRISQARRDVTFNQDVKALVPKHVDVDFLLFAMLDAGPCLFGRVQSSGHGTGVIPTDILNDLQFAVPPTEVLRELTRPLSNLNERIDANTKESQTLAALRDALLPKLLSGEIRVGEAAELTRDAIR